MNRELGSLFQKIANHTYDLSAISVDDLISNPGFAVQIKHYAHILEHYPERLDWDLKEMEKNGCTDTSLIGYTTFYFKKIAEKCTLERSRLAYGIQVANNIGLLVSKVEGIRTIGAEGRLEIRSEERGINDLDLGIDFNSPPDSMDISHMFLVKRDAERKTSIEVDLVGKGIPVTENSVEHFFGFLSGPLALRGFPIYWRSSGYLDDLLRRKNEYYDSQMKEVVKIEEELKRKGLFLGSIS